jgi:damage-control phosphatase, subfamily I
METYLECIPCFYQQVLNAATMAGADEKTKRRVMDELSKIIPDIPMDVSPTETGTQLYRLVRKVTGNNDPFKKAKEKSNELAMKHYPKFKKRVENSSDRLLAAVELAIAGNIIDHGITTSLDIQKETDKIFSEEKETIKKEDKRVFDYPSFKKAVSKAANILYLADNAGESVFDRILIEELRQHGVKEITYAVKSEPIINDVLAEDAVFCGIDKIAKIVESGCASPGTVLKFCTPAFLKMFHGAEMIISKGQGNFEALSDEKGPIFFLFKVKCEVLARYVKGKLGDVFLKNNNEYPT